VTPRPAEFAALVEFFEARTGIALGRDKLALVTGRLQGRLRARGLSNFTDYLALVQRDALGPEARALVDALTTHETSFYREPRHFEVIAAQAKAHRGRYRVWSAACSTGEEACTLALTLAEVRGLDWEIVGTDIGADTVRRARQGRYPLARGAPLSDEQRRRHCLRGVDEFDGLFCLRDELRARQRFEVANLLQPQGALGLFDAVLLRNVLIYFEGPRQKQLVANVLRQLRPGGLLLLGHAENALGYEGLAGLENSVYRFTGARAA
jgi:chemotaxis protein methyltransferase CheR